MQPVMRFRYVHEDVDARGNVRCYFWRRPGRKVRIRAPHGTEAFAAEYFAAMAAWDRGDLVRPVAVEPDAPAIGAKEGTFGALWLAYAASEAFRGLDPETQRNRQNIAASMMAEPVYPGATAVFRDFPLPRLKTGDLAVLRDRKGAALPSAANNRVKVLQALYKWAVSIQPPLVPVNIARDLERLSARTTGHHTWTEDEIAQFCARHAIGTRARLAIEIFLTTGVRRSDVVRLGRQHQRQGWIRFRPYKGRNRWDAVVEIPMLPALEAVIAASPVGDLTWLVNDRGQPFTVAGFGNWFRDRCNEAGLQHCTSHGLRKAAATAAAERGATAHQLMAIFGWLSLKEAEVYTRSAERKRMAAMGMQHMTRDGNSGP